MRKTLLSLLAVAASSRAILSIIQVVYGTVFQGGLLWLPTLVMFRDFYGYYGLQLSFLSQGLLPYRDFGYSYPPLFLYSLLPFYLLGGIYAASLPILAADAATSPLVYFFVLKFTNERLAFLAGLAYAISPFILFYEGYSWLSSQPMFFFLLLSLYLLREGRPLPSSIALAMAVLLKQEAIFVIPIYAVWLMRNHGGGSWKAIVTFLGIVFVASLPFLLIAPNQYLGSTSYGFLRTSSPSLSSAAVPLGSSALSSAQCPSTPRTSSANGPCISSSVTYPNPLLTLVINAVEWISSIVQIPLFILIAPALYTLRRRDNFLELACAYSATGFFLLFSILIHPVYGYYMVPVYGLLLASSRRLSTLLISSISPVLSLLTLVGYYQELLPLVITLGVISVQGTLGDRSVAADPPLIPEADVPVPKGIGLSLHPKRKCNLEGKEEHLPTGELDLFEGS